MIEETLQAPKLNRSPDLPVSGVTPLQVLTGGVDYETVSRFRNHVFSSLNELRRLRDWVESSAASGLQRGLALWALGCHDEAAPVLEEHKSNPAVANCLARSYTAVGRLREAERVLGRKQEDPEQAGTWLGVLEARRDTDQLRSELARLRRVASPHLSRVGAINRPRVGG